MDQINVLSMAQAVTEKQPNPSAAGNSQTQSSTVSGLVPKVSAQVL